MCYHKRKWVKWGNNMRIYNIGALNIDYVYNVTHFDRPGETLGVDMFDVIPG